MGIGGGGLQHPEVQSIAPSRQVVSVVAFFLALELGTSGLMMGFRASSVEFLVYMVFWPLVCEIAACLMHVIAACLVFGLIISPRRSMAPIARCLRVELTSSSPQAMFRVDG